MKRFGLLVLAAILGSTLTIGTYHFLNTKSENSIKIEHISGTPVVGATYTVDQKGDVVPLEFTGIAKNAMAGVVHIKSTQVQNVNNYQYRGNQDPFREFFDDDILKHFFGPNYQFGTPQQRGPQTRVGTGSGVIVNSDGYIVTNNHVIAEADDIEVTLDDNRIYKAIVIGTDPSTDLALIQIKENNLTPIPLVNSDEVEVGEWVLAVGNPFNLNSTVTAGIVSAKGRSINILQDNSAIESFIQTDAAINPGNSGGALVNLQGGLIGINTAIASPTGAYAGYGFAVPANIVAKVVEDLLKFGMVQRGYLGLMIRNVDGNLAKEKNLDVTEGVYIDSITANSAAGEAGIKIGDVVVKVNGVNVKTSSKLLELIGRHHPGDKVPLLVDRKGKNMEFEVTLKNKEGNTDLTEKNTEAILDVLGAEFEEINRSTAKKLNINGGLKITKLHDGKLKRFTDIKPGFIVTKVDGKPIKKVDELTQILETKKGGVMIEGIYEDYPRTYYYAFGL